MKATRFYLALCEALNSRKEHLGWPYHQCDDRSGLNDGHSAKLLHPNTPSGRQGRWETMQLLVDAMFPKGVRIVLIAEGEDMPSALSIPETSPANPAAMRHWRLSRHFRELGRKGGKAYGERTSPAKRKRQARRAAKARWHKPKVVEITPAKQDRT